MKQQNMFGGVDEMDNLGRVVLGPITGDKVTCWYRWNNDKERWDFNHYSEGWLNTTHPVPKSKEQQVWLRYSWKTKHRWMIGQSIINAEEYERRTR